MKLGIPFPVRNKTGFVFSRRRNPLEYARLQNKTCSAIAGEWRKHIFLYIFISNSVLTFSWAFVSLCPSRKLKSMLWVYRQNWSCRVNFYFHCLKIVRADDLRSVAWLYIAFNFPISNRRNAIDSRNYRFKSLLLCRYSWGPTINVYSENSANLPGNLQASYSFCLSMNEV